MLGYIEDNFQSTSSFSWRNAPKIDNLFFVIDLANSIEHDGLMPLQLHRINYTSIYYHIITMEISASQ